MIHYRIHCLLAYNDEVKSVECLFHALMCSVSVVTVVFIHTMEDDQRLNTLVHEGDTLQHCKGQYSWCPIPSSGPVARHSYVTILRSSPTFNHSLFISPMICSVSIS